MTTLRQRIAEWLAPPEKAATGIGVSMMTYGPQLSAFMKDPRKAIKQAQRVGIENLYIRAAERVIGDRFSTIGWHLEDEAGELLENEAVQRVLERPYMPRPGDPVSSTPQTRTGLWRITSRHLGLTGNAFWYLDQANALNGWPLDVIYINPARMTPATDDHDNLLGWVLDADLPGHGTPLPLDSVLHFRLEPPDSGHYGIGLVESAFSRAEMLRLADHHANEVLHAGGRLSGIFAPSANAAGGIPQDAYEQLKRDLRNISEDPNAARRALVLKAPIEYTKTAQSMGELDISGLAELGKDGILSLWGVPETQLAARSAVGLNSGETRKYDEATLWQNAVGPRLRAFAEVIQFQLLDRLEPNPQLVIEEPEFDDEQPRYDLLVKAVNAPLTNAERRAIIGKEPLGVPEIDDAIWLPINLQAIASAPVDVAEKARAVPGQDRLREAAERAMQRDVEAVLRKMKADVVAKVKRHADHLATHPKDDTVWWDRDKWEREMEAALKPHALNAAEMTVDKVDAMLGGG